jgi:hypothetical protein
MTLAKAIEAVREHCCETKAALDYAGYTKDYTGGSLKDAVHHIEQALAVLPEPKTEEEIKKIIHNTVVSSIRAFGKWEAADIVRALRNANVLFVKEV